jgi:hypothetical protein
MSPRCLLWVEGKDDQHVVWNLAHYHALPETFTVVSKDGVAELFEALPVQLGKGSNLERLGIVLDADQDPAGRWDRIRTILRSVGYASAPEVPSPGGTVLYENGKPVFGAWVMPNNDSVGMLEDFAASLIPVSDPLWIRAGDAVDAIPDADRRFPPVRRSKAHIHTWLAWQEYPGSPMGQAISMGDLDANAPPAHAFVAWLKRLFVDEPNA